MQRSLALAFDWVVLWVHFVMLVSRTCEHTIEKDTRYKHHGKELFHGSCSSSFGRMAQVLSGFLLGVFPPCFEIPVFSELNRSVIAGMYPIW